jgi:hypothetical protein
MSEKELPIEVFNRLEIMRQEDLKSLAAKERELANLIRDIDARQNLRQTRIEDTVARIEKFMEKHEDERKREEASIFESLESVKDKIQEFEKNFTALGTKENIKYELIRYGIGPVVTGIVVATLTIVVKLVFGV